MDGVIYHGNRLLPGVKEFVDWLYKEEKEFLFLTNSSERSPKELQQKLARMGLDVDESHFLPALWLLLNFWQASLQNAVFLLLAHQDLSMLFMMPVSR